MEQITVNEKAVERLKRKIILQKQIEEEAQCYSNQ